MNLVELLKKTLLNVESLRFAVVGVIATVLHYGIYAGLYYLFTNYTELREDWAYNISYTLGYVLSLIANIFLSFRWSFRTQFTWLKTVKFLGCHVINYFLHIIFLNLFIWIGIHPLISPVLVYCIVVPINLLLVRRALKNTFLYDE